MGRRKIEIKTISSEKNRQATFNKRRVGLMKKAMELSILCGAEVGLVVMFDGKLHTYSSAPMEDIQSMYNNYEGRYESLTNDDHDLLQPGKTGPFKKWRNKRKTTASCQKCKFNQNYNNQWANYGSQYPSSYYQQQSMGMSMGGSPYGAVGPVYSTAMQQTSKPRSQCVSSLPPTHNYSYLPRNSPSTGYASPRLPQLAGRKRSASATNYYSQSTVSARPAKVMRAKRAMSTRHRDIPSATPQKFQRSVAISQNNMASPSTFFKPTTNSDNMTIEGIVALLKNNENNNAGPIPVAHPANTAALSGARRRKSNKPSLSSRRGTAVSKLNLSSIKPNNTPIVEDSRGNKTIALTPLPQYAPKMSPVFTPSLQTPLSMSLANPPLTDMMASTTPTLLQSSAIEKDLFLDTNLLSPNTFKVSTPVVLAQ